MLTPCNKFSLKSLITLNNKIVSVIQKQPIVRALWNFINNTRNTVRFPIRIPYNYGRILHHFRDNARYSSTINTFCRTQSVKCNFFTFDHVTFIQFKICCCIQNFIESDDFSLRYGDITIFKMAAVRYLGIVLPPYETTYEVSVAGLQLPVKFHINLIHRSEDIVIWIFRIFGLKCLFRPPKWGGFWETLDP